MNYILDFDHTLFDARAFVQDAHAYKDSGVYVTPAIWDILDAKNYFFDDALPFLQSHTKEHMRILTAMTPSLGPEAREFQKVKLERSGSMDYVSETICMEGDKGPYIQKMYTNEPTVFVDDTVEHLLSAKKHCPDIQVVQIIRPELAGVRTSDETIPVITSLDELDSIVARNLKKYA